MKNEKIRSNSNHHQIMAGAIVVLHPVLRLQNPPLHLLLHHHHPQPLLAHFLLGHLAEEGLVLVQILDFHLEG
jgi:hypothetical protein